ncbi:MAG: hypothetical protein EXS16_15940 [Gemmataceae bacterium]|nr:hypothetical protein [Gemmataceae bacterium]
MIPTIALITIFLPSIALAQPARPMVSVGIDVGDLRGNDHRVLQAAVDYIANFGGGTVEIGAGRFTLRNALQLRNNVHFVGLPGGTVLAIGGGRKAALASDVAKGATEITLVDARGFELGDGIALEDSAGHGFEVTTATLVARLGPRTFRISHPAESDYLVKRNAEAKHAISGISGVNVKNASVKGITVEGNHATPGSEYLGGCRGGGVYLFGCENVVVSRCVVRKYHGDAISFQGKCTKLNIEYCVCEDNSNVGMHPGSGSHDCIVRENTLRKNGYVGLFVCVGVRKVLFDKNVISNNAGCGISIGFDDTDNTFRSNRIVNNAETGVLFRRDSPKAKHGAHRNVFENNTIKENLGPRPEKSNSRASSAGKACVVIEGAHHDLIFRDNELGFSQAHAGSAFLHDSGVMNLQLHGNRLYHLDNLTKEYREP